ncbi:zinc transporter ZIP9 isoform X3 [Scyliorhinus torazame]|uniref:zinc transporter ZIP9 isoform X3 n=1 Tax=Scyliorhinus torazame TaxID=75743 RepID=UPI003B59CA41
MDGAVAIILLSLAMFGGCLLLGLIPLTIRLAQEKLKFVTVLGAGLLCGTALAIIIPEGIELLLSDLMAEPRTGPGAGSSLTATLGLVIHAAADGVALGTAAGSSQISLQVIVFVAVILHKAPASFGLVSYLMHAGLEKRQIQKHLFVFSLAAPLLAITTYFIVSKSSMGSRHQTKATGIGLLFSAGTFLYVASVHILPEVSSQTHHGVTSSSGKKGLGILESLTLIVGCTIPVFMSLGLHDV